MGNFKCGDIVEAEITGITKYGIFVRLEDNFFDGCTKFIEK